MASRQLGDLERERDGFLTYEKRIILERDEILKNIRNHLDGLDAEIVRLGGRPRDELRQGSRRGSSNSLGRLNRMEAEEKKEVDDEGVTVIAVGAFPPVRKQRQRKSLDTSSNNNGNAPNSNKKSNLEDSTKKPRAKSCKSAEPTIENGVPNQAVINGSGEASKPKRKRGRPRKNRDGQGIQNSQIQKKSPKANVNMNDNSNHDNGGKAQIYKKVVQDVEYSPHYSPNTLESRAENADLSLKTSSILSAADMDSMNSGGKKPSSNQKQLQQQLRQPKQPEKEESATEDALKRDINYNSFDGETPIISNVNSHDSEDLTLHTLAKLAINGGKVGNGDGNVVVVDETQQTTASTTVAAAATTTTAGGDANASDGSVSLEDWTCECGEKLSCKRARCGKCRRWRGGQRQKRWTLDKENQSKKAKKEKGASKDSKPKTSKTSTENVHVVYRALSAVIPAVGSGDDDNESGSVKNVMEKMVSAVSYIGMKAEAAKAEKKKKRKKKKADNAEEGTSTEDKPKRKRGRPRKNPLPVPAQTASADGLPPIPAIATSNNSAAVASTSAPVSIFNSAPGEPEFDTILHESSSPVVSMNVTDEALPAATYSSNVDSERANASAILPVANPPVALLNATTVDAPITTLFGDSEKSDETLKNVPSPSSQSEPKTASVEVVEEQGAHSSLKLGEASKQGVEESNTSSNIFEVEKPSATKASEDKIQTMSSPNQSNSQPQVLESVGQLQDLCDL